MPIAIKSLRHRGTLVTLNRRMRSRKKKGLRGRRNPLKRRESEKENQEFSLIVFGWVWRDLPGFGVGLKIQIGVVRRPTPGGARDEMRWRGVPRRGATGLGGVPTVKENIDIDRLGSRREGENDCVPGRRHIRAGSR